MSSPEAHQTSEFEAQSLRFVETHLQDFPGAPTWVLESPVLQATRPTTILDVGCGPGTYLMSLVAAFNPQRAVGLEPSTDAAALLNQHYADDSRVSFDHGSAHCLPFATDEFDLVVCWSVLHWVGRNEYLQALGELVRVTRRHLLVMDFVAGRNYRVPYAHQPGMFTYKQDFVPAILASGVMTVSEDRRWWDAHRPGDVEPLEESELEPFLGNELNYHARRGVLFTKDYATLPSHTEVDFAI